MNNAEMFKNMENIRNMNDAIMQKISIPANLLQRTSLSIGALDTVSLDFYLNPQTRLTRLNSPVQVRIIFQVTDDYGRCVPGLCGMDVTIIDRLGIASEMKKLKSASKLISVDIICKRVNAWLAEFDKVLLSKRI